MTYLLIKKKNGAIKSISNNKIKFDKEIFELKEYSPTAAEKAFMDKNYIMSFEDNKIVFTKPPIINKEELIDQIDKTTTILEIKNILKKLI